MKFPKKFKNFLPILFCSLVEKEISENFNIPENNITSVEAANLPRYC
jgi:hypothetical protein